MSYVNAPVLAADRGIEARLIADGNSPAFRNVITLRGCMADSTPLAVSGTLTGPKQVEKLVGIDDLDFELPLADHLLVLRYQDRPGVIGAIGGLLGDAAVNIGSMQVARPDHGDQALSVLTLDQAVPAAVLEDIVARIGAMSGRRVDLT